MKADPTSETMHGLALPMSGGFLALFGASLVICFFANAKAVHGVAQQPIEFNHKLHVEEAELECATCHPLYAHETSSGLPGNAICALCHLEPQGESAEEARLVELLEQGVPLEWQPLFRQPPHVFFSHRRHVVVAALECTVCHGDIGASTAPPDRVATLTMDQCLDCHEQHQASTDCSACHR